MWKDLLFQTELSIMASPQGLLNLQLAWCFFELGVTKRVEVHLDPLLPFPASLDLEEIGKLLAAKGNIRLLADFCLAEILSGVHCQWILRAATEGFREMVDVKGIICVAMLLSPVEREFMMGDVLLNYWLDWLNCTLEGPIYFIIQEQWDIWNHSEQCTICATEATSTTILCPLHQWHHHIVLMKPPALSSATTIRHVLAC